MQWYGFDIRIGSNTKGRKTWSWTVHKKLAQPSNRIEKNKWGQFRIFVDEAEALPHEYIAVYENLDCYWVNSTFTLIYFNLSTSICKICIIITRAHVMVLATIECVLPMKSDIIDHYILSILCRFIVTTIASA